MPPLVQLKNVFVQFSKITALDDVSLELERGKITTIIGPNGAGKSTLIKVILGLQKPTSGQIIKVPKLTIGYVPQKLKLNDTLPLNVRRFLTLSKNHSQQGCDDILKMVGAEHLKMANMHTLSGGETQRVLLARALLLRPELLVLDEPTQGVDTQGQSELYDLIENIRHQFDCSVLLVSHDLHVVMAKTDHVICLHRHICCSGDPKKVSQDTSYTDLFGFSEHNLALYQHNHNSQHKHALSGEVIKCDSSCNGDSDA